MTPPICFKFGTFVDISYTNKNANFQLCKSSGFRDMTLKDMGKRSFFAPTQHIKTIITLVLLGAESWLIAPFKALIFCSVNMTPHPVTGGYGLTRCLSL